MAGSITTFIRKQIEDRIKRALAEESIMVISVLKWTVLATIIGAIVGLSSGGFLKLLQWATGFSGRYSYYFLLLPAGFFISSVLVRYLAPDAKGHGTEKVIEAVHKRSGKIALPVVPVKLAATV
ncbi:MAG: chloride channel protein, partial [Thermoleophilia bacterium]